MHHPLYRLYFFPTTSLSDKQCASLNEIIDGPILNKLHINRHFPKKVLYCSHARGGLNFPSFRILQAQQGLLTMIKHFRWNKTIGKDMLSALSSVQLISGLVTPIFEDVTTPLIPPPWMVPTPSKMSDRHDRLTVDRMPMVPTQNTNAFMTNPSCLHSSTSMAPQRRDFTAPTTAGSTHDASQPQT